MSKKLLLSLSAVAVLGATAFIATQGGLSGLRSSSLEDAGGTIHTAVLPDKYSCVYPFVGGSIQGYYDLLGNSLNSDLDTRQTNEDQYYDATGEGVQTNVYGFVPYCTPEDIAQYGSMNEKGIFIRRGLTGTDILNYPVIDEELERLKNLANNPTTTNPVSPPSQNPTTPTVVVPQYQILLNVWNNAKTTLANLETELKTLTDSKKTLTDRKAVLEKSTGTDSIKVVTARLAAIEKELAAQLTALTKNTKLKSAEEYEPAKAQALADFDAIAAEMRPFQNQLTTLTNIDFKQLNIDIAKLKTDLTALTKIKPQTTQTKTDIANKNKEITAKNLEITNKNKEITAKKAEIAKIQTRKTAAQTKYSTLKDYQTKYIQPFRTKTSNLNTEKATLTSKLALLTAELADIKNKLGERLPALPELITKQRTLVTEAQKNYTEYVQTLGASGSNGTGTSEECNTTTGENCDGAGTENGPKMACEKDGTMLWDSTTQECSPISTHDSEGIEEMKKGCWKPGSSGWKINGFGGLLTNTLCDTNSVKCVIGDIVDGSFKTDEYKDYGSWVVIKSWKCIYQQKPECPVVEQSCNIRITQNEGNGGNY